MAFKFRDCPTCGRGILEIAFQSHVCQAPGVVAIAPPRAPSNIKTAPPLRALRGNAGADVNRKRTEVPSHSRKEISPSEGAKAAPRQNPDAVKATGAKAQPSHREVKVHNPDMGMRLYFAKSREEKRARLEWQLSLLQQKEAASKVHAAKSIKDKMSSTAGESVKAPSNPAAVDWKPPRTKFVSVEMACSCGGENENCCKCSGTGIELKRLATTAGADTTLFSKNTSSTSVAIFASDSRGHPFSMREKGQFDSSALHDDYDDEAAP